MLCFVLFRWGVLSSTAFGRFQPALFWQGRGSGFCLLGPGGIDRFAFLADPDDFTYILTVTYLYYTILYSIDHTVWFLYTNELDLLHLID